jgi:hypothetical protein
MPARGLPRQGMQALNWILAVLLSAGLFFGILWAVLVWLFRVDLRSFKVEVHRRRGQHEATSVLGRHCICWCGARWLSPRTAPSVSQPAAPAL